jgi:uncharacterized iron-regulated membrane protein
MDSKLLRTFYLIHKWTGIFVGFALFVAFYAGAMTMFEQDIKQWQQPLRTVSTSTQSPIEQGQALLDYILTNEPLVGESRLTLLLGGVSGAPEAYFFDHQGKRHYSATDSIKEDGMTRSELAELINELHFSLGIPLIGGYLMGLICLLYALALVSGTFIYWPRIKKEFLAFRTGRNAKLFWLDTHNLLGIVSLPFHVVFAWTGAVLSLGLAVMFLLNPLAFQGRLLEVVPTILGTLPAEPHDARKAPMQALRDLQDMALQSARQCGVADFEINSARIQYPGRANALIEFHGQVPRTLGASGAITLSGVDGLLTSLQIPSCRDSNQAVLSFFNALHFGNFGGYTLKIIYALLGLAGAGLFYSGNILFIESRRKAGQIEQSPLVVVMSKATVGVCLGFCAALAGAFVSTQLFQYFAQGDTYWSLAQMESFVCFSIWGLAIIWSFVRTHPIHSARDLLLVSACLYGLSAAFHVLLWQIYSGIIVDLVLLFLVIVFAGLARMVARRARNGVRGSLWSGV